ncbi:DUF6537 domain-containing protein [Vreelandella titanicae]|uniref:DUF6537 domain-containing protein n=1 Tax=Vreelandella titanicae TaxID=664683 RepID=UPI003D2D4EC2
MEKNRQAFAWGRLAAVEPDYLQQHLDKMPLSANATLDEVVARNRRHLERYQNRAWAERYVTQVTKVREAETALKCGQSLSEAVAHQLYRLMAYKDEYEVARLYTQSDFLDEIKATFSGDYQLTFHLAPPLIGGRKDAQGRPSEAPLRPLDAEGNGRVGKDARFAQHGSRSFPLQRPTASSTAPYWLITSSLSMS